MERNGRIGIYIGEPAALLSNYDLMSGSIGGSGTYASSIDSARDGGDGIVLNASSATIANGGTIVGGRAGVSDTAMLAP